MSPRMKVRRICQWCGNEFTAQTTVTKFCGDKCAKRAYSERKKIEKIKQSNEETKKQIQLPLLQIQAKEFLSIKETMRLLNISRTTVWRILKENKIQSTKLGGKVIITRSSLNSLFKI